MVKQERKTYRHGNLKADAISAACTIVELEGHQNLSLRKVADKVGVVHRSLYNHFENRDALLDGVAMDGFNRLADEVEPCTDRSTFVSAYLGFSLSHGALYDLMMSRPHATMSENPPLQTAVHKVITKSMQFFGKENASSEENRRAVMKVFMLLHGGAMLKTNGILDVRDDKHFIEELSNMTIEL